jgi:hypothetical protein
MLYREDADIDSPVAYTIYKLARCGPVGSHSASIDVGDIDAAACIRRCKIVFKSWQSVVKTVYYDTADHYGFSVQSALSEDQKVCSYQRSLGHD